MNHQGRSTSWNTSQIPSGRPLGPPAQRPKGPRSTFVKVVASVIVIALILGALFLVGRVVTIVASWVRGSEETSPPIEDRGPGPVTPELDFSGFAPGKIIEDEVFYDSSAMDQEQIQTFLNKVNDGCQTGADGTKCVAVYTENSLSFDANDYCFAFEGAKNDPVASVVTKAFKACGINPQTLLVMLQKEQGLLTASGGHLNAKRYETAMGYGCPDHAECNPEYFGLANQVYNAALQLRMYANLPDRYNIKPFADNSIAYHPNPECGSATVHVENSATAGLYNYTPYQPDQEVLGSGPGACSSFGNLNFYGYFKAWFG